MYVCVTCVEQTTCCHMQQYTCGNWSVIFVGPVFSIRLHVGSGDQTQIARLVWHAPSATRSSLQPESSFLKKALWALSSALVPTQRSLLVGDDQRSEVR